MINFRYVLAAVDYAAKAHGDQKRKTGEPFITHPIEVMRRVMLMMDPETENTDVLVAAALHDVVEDCPKVSIGDIELAWGKVVAAIVAELTNDNSLSRHDKKQKMIAKARTYSKAARIIKMADRHHNLETGVGMPIEWMDRYAKESRHLLLNLAAEEVNDAFATFLKQAYENIEELERRVALAKKKEKAGGE